MLIYATMGVTGLYSVMPHESDRATLKQLKKHGITRIGLDVSPHIHQYGQGGNHIYGILGLINGLRDAGITDIYAVFDNPKPNKWKIGEAVKRSANRQRIRDKLNECDDDEKRCKMSKQLFTITDTIALETQYLLVALGIDCITAPPGFEAEHIGARLQTHERKVDALMTNDSDAIVWGATMLRKNHSLTGVAKYYIYRPERLLDENKIMADELVDAAIHMGNDFHPGTKGVGFRTYLKRKDTLTLTDEQLDVKKYMLSTPPPSHVVKGHFDSDLLCEWLRSLGFQTPKVVRPIGSANTSADGLAWLQSVKAKVHVASIESLAIAGHDDGDDDGDECDVSDLSDVSAD